MLQYFIDTKYHSIFAPNRTPHLKYLCEVNESQSNMPRNMHMHKDLVEILLVTNGTGLYIIDGDKYTAKKGDIIFYNSNVLHDEFGGFGSELATYCIGISNLHLNNLEKNKIIADSYCPIIPTGKYFNELLALLNMLKNNISQPQEKELCHTLMQAFVLKSCYIIEHCGISKQRTEHSLAAKVRAYIDTHYSEDISLEKIAQAVKANRYYLAHTFKDTTGFSPMQYLTRRRIGEAQNLLINTDMSITEIAANVGYNNSNYFQNVFRQNVGLTPGQYRKKWKF